MSIYETALTVFGVNGRIEKLREESIELALACERYLSGNGALHDVVAESADVSVVIESIKACQESAFAGAFLKGQSKLRAAIDAQVTRLDNVNAQ